MKTNSYENKVALVTGGTSGIGKATALAFANAGAKVVLTGRRKKEGTEVVAEIKKRGGIASFFKADAAEDSHVRAAVDFVLATYDRLDIAFNNAGVEAGAPLDQVTEEQYRKVFDINIWGVLNSMKHEVAAMLKTGGRAIVNTSSALGHVGVTQATRSRQCFSARDAWCRSTPAPDVPQWEPAWCVEKSGRRSPLFAESVRNAQKISHCNVRRSAILNTSEPL